MGWGKTGPAHSFPPQKCSNFSFNLSDFQFMLLFTVFEKLRMNYFNERFKLSNLQTYKVIDTSTLWGGERLGRPVLSPLENVLTFLFIFLIFWFQLLFYCILTLMNELFQRENQVFIPTSFLVLPHYGVGKDWAGPFFPPSKMFRPFYLFFSLSV